MKNVIVITDNRRILEGFLDLVERKKDQLKGTYDFSYGYSPVNSEMKARYGTSSWIRPVSIKTEWEQLAANYDVIFSLHCKQLFPASLVSAVRCINVHPGLNPYNRGWYPQVFSILNGLPCGATIHEMDEQLDHGPVICQLEVPLESWDTSLTAYEKILHAEMTLLQEHLVDILDKRYQPSQVGEGNVNGKKDFEKLCRIDLDNRDTFANHLNRLRALTHGTFLNAYYIDEAGKKVFIKIELIKEKREPS